MRFRYGTRGSLLALTQSDDVIRRLNEIHPKAEFERVVIHTSGDRFAQENPSSDASAGASDGLQRSPAESKSDAVNVKALFVKEIEEALLKGEIDFAVHSSKDLPVFLPQDLLIAAYPTREDARDVFIGGPDAPKWNKLKPGAVVATSSLRRRIQLQMLRPDISFAAMRGNVDTRLRKLSEGAVAGLVLAQAGLKRLGRDTVPHEVLPSEIVVPAPGQGALALEAAKSRRDVLELLAPMDDPKTRLEVECERSFMTAIGGGCRTPLGAYARSDGEHIHLNVFWSDEQGQNPARRHGRCPADLNACRKLIVSMAAELLAL